MLKIAKTTAPGSRQQRNSATARTLDYKLPHEFFYEWRMCVLDRIDAGVYDEMVVFSQTP